MVAATVETVVTAAAVAAMAAAVAVAAGQCGVIGGVIGGGRWHSVGMRYEQDHQYVVGLLQQACAAEGICAPYASSLGCRRWPGGPTLRGVEPRRPPMLSEAVTPVQSLIERSCAEMA